MKAQNLSLNRLKLWVFFISVSLVLPISSIALIQEEEIDDKSYFMCRLEGEVRTIRMLKRLDGSCYVNYTKKGIDQKISDSKNLVSCPEVFQRIKSNLEQAGWRCKNISSSNITNSSTQ
jgi:hypothetical protein